VAPQKICDAEMAAVVEAAQRFGNELRGHAVMLVVDNTSVLHAITKGRSDALSLSELIFLFKRILFEKDIKVVDVRWISSAENPADEPSRGHSVIPRKIHGIF
jgi:hypothetical protein